MAAAGKADDYVRLVREALALTEPGANPEIDLLLNGLLCQACTRAGLLREALAANDAALQAIEIPGDPNAGTVLGHSLAQRVGFDVAHWVRCLRAYPLIALGHEDEARLWIARLVQIEDARIEPIIQFIPHWSAVELAWHRGNADLAKWHATEVERFAERSAPVPYVFIKALLCQGMAASSEGDFGTAAKHFHAALATARQGRVGLESEARLLALLVDTYARVGEFERAVLVRRGLGDCANADRSLRGMPRRYRRSHSDCCRRQCGAAPRGCWVACSSGSIDCSDRGGHFSSLARTGSTAG